MLDWPLVKFIAQKDSYNLRVSSCAFINHVHTSMDISVVQLAIIYARRKLGVMQSKDCSV